MSIKIKSKEKDFRRCGIAHPTEFVEYSDDRFSKDELAILKAEPMLIVEVVKKGASTTAASAAAAKAAEEKAAKAEAERIAQEEAEKEAEAKRLADEEAGKKDGEDLTLLTVAQLTDEIANFQPETSLKGLKKTDLVEILKAQREKIAAE